MGGRPAGPAEPAAAPMLALQPGMDRYCHELGAQRDRQVRLHSVQTDLALDLPPSIPLPDGEEMPYGSATRLHLRDPEQESEIYQKCVRPPPNRTVWDGESPRPYRSSSAGILSADWSSGSSSASSGSTVTTTTGSSSASSGSFVVRCHSVSSTCSKRPADLLGRTVRCLSGKRYHHPPAPSEEPTVTPPPPSVIVAVPVQSRRCRRLSAFSEAAPLPLALASLPTVQCVTPSACEPSEQRTDAESDCGTV